MKSELSDWWKSKYNLFEMTEKDVENLINNGVDIVLVPVGSTEQHGPYCILGTDSLAAWITTKLASEKTGVPHTPLVWTGYSPHHLIPKTGTITLREETFRNLLYDIGRSLIHHGFNKIIYVTGHSSNIKVIDPVLRSLRYDTGALAFLFRADAEVLPRIPEIAKLLERPLDENPGWHAGEIETSLNLLYSPDYVGNKLKETISSKPWTKNEVHAPLWLPQDKFTKKNGSAYIIFKGYDELIMAPMEHREYSDRGIVGNPQGASAEKAQKIYQILADILSDFINELKKIKVEVKHREFDIRV